jgi:hypothetical protein
MCGFDMVKLPKLLFRFHLVVPISIIKQKSVEDIDLACKQLSSTYTILSA